MNFGQKRVTEAVGNLSGNTFMKYIDNGSRVMKSLRTSTLPLNLSSQKENEFTYSVTSYARYNTNRRPLKMIERETQLCFIGHHPNENKDSNLNRVFSYT